MLNLYRKNRQFVEQGMNKSRSASFLNRNKFKWIKKTSFGIWTFLGEILPPNSKNVQKFHLYYTFSLRTFTHWFSQKKSSSTFWYAMNFCSDHFGRTSSNKLGAILSFSLFGANMLTRVDSADISIAEKFFFELFWMNDSKVYFLNECSNFIKSS